MVALKQRKRALERFAPKILAKYKKQKQYQRGGTAENDFASEDGPVLVVSPHPQATIARDACC
jgi:hypothetical protein